MNSRVAGREGENIAEEYLIVMGYDILERNFRNRLGEIDIVAMDGKTLVFIEVKKRNSGSHGFPADAVDMKKQRRIGMVALSYIACRKIMNLPCRFDVVSIMNDRIELYKNAFELPEGKVW